MSAHLTSTINESKLSLEKTIELNLLKDALGNQAKSFVESIDCIISCDYNCECCGTAISYEMIDIKAK